MVTAVWQKKRDYGFPGIYIYILCVCIHSLNVAFYRIDRMSVCCLDVGFLRDVAGTTLTSRPFFGPDHKAIAPSSSFEGRSAPQKVRTASNQCQLVGWWVNWYFRIFRILQDTSGYFRSIFQLINFWSIFTLFGSSPSFQLALRYRLLSRMVAQALHPSLVGHATEIQRECRFHLAFLPCAQCCYIPAMDHWCPLSTAGPRSSPQATAYSVAGKQTRKMKGGPG